MSRTLVPESLIHSHESLEKSRRVLESLKSVFPVDRCRELVVLKIEADEAKLLAEDPTIRSYLEGFNISDLDLNDPEMPEEVREGLAELKLLSGKHVGELPLQLPPDPALKAKRIEDQVVTIVNLVVTGWINVLHEVRYEAKNNPVRLDRSFLPPLELTRYDGVGWDEWLTNSPLDVSAEHIRELMSLYAVKLTPMFDVMIANNPDGFELIDGIFIGKDKDGFYLLPKVRN